MSEYFDDDASDEVAGFTLTEQQLFDRLVDLFSEQLTLSADISQLKKDAKFHKNHNPNGIPATELSLVVKSAKLRAQEQFEEFSYTNALVVAKFKQLTKYDA